jgi:hypothetical protein
MSDWSPDEKATKRLVDLVEQSGFPLQLAIEEVARSGYDREHYWDPVTRELPWLDRENAKDGFVDLVLLNGIMMMTVECKRSPTPWIFLMPEGARDEGAERFRCRVAEGTNRGLRQSAYFDMRTDPMSTEAEFCVVGGSGNRHRLLEKYCFDLVTATEAIAHAREEVLHDRKEPFRFGYLPLIVTTARLYSCEFGPAKLDLAEATLGADRRFREERWIRFRKSLSTRTHAPATDDLDRVKKEGERSVFVVQATHFGEFLKATRSGRFQYSETRSWPLELSS